MKKKIGLFGGTFNPPHYGHLNLALELREAHSLEEVWWLPNQLSPLRQKEPLLEAKHRLYMLELMLEEIEEFKICQLELERSAPSYTIDTVKEILKSHPDDEFFLLLGEDVLYRFGDWKETLQIVRHIALLIGLRPHSDLLEHLCSVKLDEEIKIAITQGLTSIRQMDISATDLRERLNKRLYCKHLFPGKILDYIYENQLYFNLGQGV